MQGIPKILHSVLRRFNYTLLCIRLQQKSFKSLRNQVNANKSLFTSLNTYGTMDSIPEPKKNSFQLGA